MQGERTTGKSEMNRLLVNCGRKVMEVSHDHRELSKYLKEDFFPRESIPSYGCTDAGGSSDGKLRLRQGSEKATKTSFEYPESLYFPDAVYSLIMQFAKIYALESTYLVHSSAVGNAERGVLVVGDAGSGKTTVSILLSILGSMNLLSNDRTIVNLQNREIEGGTLDIDLRPASFPFLQRVVDEPKFRLFHEHVTKKRRDDRAITKYEMGDEDLNLLGIRTAKRARLSEVYFIYTDPALTQTRAQVLNPKEAAKRLHYFFSQYYRGDGRYFISSKLPMPDLSDAVRISLENAVMTELLERRQLIVGEIIGNPFDVARTIHEKDFGPEQDERPNATLTDRKELLDQLRQLWRKIPSVKVPALMRSVSNFADKTGAKYEDLLEISYLFLAKKLEEQGIFLTKSAFTRGNLVDLRYPQRVLAEEVYQPALIDATGRVVGGFRSDRILNPWSFYSSEPLSPSPFEPLNLPLEGMVRFFETNIESERHHQSRDSLLQIIYLFSVLRANGVVAGSNAIGSLDTPSLYAARGEFIRMLGEKTGIIERRTKQFSSR